MRLRTPQQYRRMTQKTVKFTGRWIFVDIRMTSASYSRLGIIASKRYGEAHQRNRFKRLVREAFRLSYPHYKCTFDVVVRPRSEAITASLSEIKNELLDFIGRASKQVG